MHRNTPYATLICLLIGSVFFLLLVRLFFLQVLDYQQLGTVAATSSIRRVWVQPPRGRMFDRHGTIIVDNQPLYTVKLIPSEFNPGKRTYLASLLEMDPDDLAALIEKGRSFNRFAAVTISRNIEPRTISRLSENLWQLPGVFIAIDNKRMYSDSLRGAHLIGYLRFINKKQLEELAEQGYTQDDKIGFNGLEKMYEERLKGQKGANFELINPHGRYVGKYDNGAHDIPSVKGDDLYLSIDSKLQELAEKLLRATGRSGAVVAIDPANGGILAMASAPDFSLNTFNGAIDKEGWRQIATSPLKPLFNRTVQAVYPPGSIYKMILAMAALEEHSIDPKKMILDSGAFYYGGRRFLSNGGRGHGMVDMKEAIAVSSNVYFYKLIFNVGFENWTRYGTMFGFGEKTGIDLPGERAGLMPSVEYYDRRYGKGRWTKGYIVSLAIGQGELGTTPVQLAAYAAAIANNGTLFQPHIVNGYRDTGTGRYFPLSYGSQNLSIGESTFALVKAGMSEVVERGTGTLARVPGFTVAGKTGTAQNPHGKDHAWFIAFAPVEKPTIALAVLVENAGFGGTVSAPIARELIRYYLNKDPNLTKEPRSLLPVSSEKTKSTDTTETIEPVPEDLPDLQPEQQNNDTGNDIQQ